jgi:hypothetical protein
MRSRRTEAKNISDMLTDSTNLDLKFVPTFKQQSLLNWFENC